jgi:hypothetical protein
VSYSSPQQYDHDVLLRPTRLYVRTEVLARPTAVPAKPGVYAWYFRETPPGVPLDGCHLHQGLPLLYVGISPSRPPNSGKASSKQSLARRIRYHFAGNAAGSTLRLTLGCLLADKLGIRLTRVGSGGRYTFTNPGEIRLDAWLEQNARVCWLEHSVPWEIEKRLFKVLSLPLNIDGNDHHPYVATLRACRQDARRAADAAECVADGGGPRRLQAT